MAHHPCIWTVEHRPLPPELAVPRESLAHAPAVGILRGGQLVDCSEGAPPVGEQIDDIEVAVLEVGPLQCVSRVTLTSTLGHHREAVLCVRDGRYWAVFFDHALTWRAVELSGEHLTIVHDDDAPPPLASHAPTLAAMSRVERRDRDDGRDAVETIIELADIEERVAAHQAAAAEIRRTDGLHAPEITDEQIRARMETARAATEMDLVDLCEMALAGHAGLRAYLAAIIAEEGGAEPGIAEATAAANARTIVAESCDPAGPDLDPAA